MIVILDSTFTGDDLIIISTMLLDQFYYYCYSIYNIFMCITWFNNPDYNSGYKFNSSTEVI